MSVVFKSRNDVLVRSRDGRNFVVQEDIDLVTDTGTHYRVPIGAESDGASTPPELWAEIPPFGAYWLAALVHDSAYRNTLLRQMENGFWVPAMLNKDDSDTLLLDCMAALGVEQVRKEAIYEGVHFFGWKAFRDDRALSTGGSPGG
jgi:hypothetical protein